MKLVNTSPQISAVAVILKKMLHVMLHLHVSFHPLDYGSFMECRGILTTSTHASNKHFLPTDYCV